MEIKYDLRPLLKISNALHAAGKQIPVILNRAINHTGDKARTQMRNVLVGQTGLKRKTIVKAVKSVKASPGSSYVIKAKGGNIRLQFFAARETRKGVTAAPWGQRRLFAGTFMKGGQFPKRVALNRGVLQRVGKGRLPVHTVKSGLFIADELISGASQDAFNSTVEREMPGRIAHELYRVLGG